MTTRIPLLVAAGLALTLAPRLSLAQEDGGVEDAPVEDGGVEDVVSVPDAAMPDAAQPDAAMPDAARPDISLPDTSLPDSLAPDASEGCGTVSYIGECQGNNVLYCTGVEVVEVDCVAQYGASATCGLLDCADQAAGCYGYFCVTRGGEACGGEDDLPCDVAVSQGCIDGLCTSSSTCDPNSYEPQCDGDQLMDCSHTVNSFDCSVGGVQARTCGLSASGEAACVGLVGDSCGGETGRECQQGLTCTDGACVGASGGADGGGGGGGDGDGDGEGGCLCAGAAPATPLLALAVGLALVGALLRRRQSRRV